MNEDRPQPSGGTSVCHACQQEQPLANFYQNKSGKYGSECKECARKRHKQRMKEGRVSKQKRRKVSRQQEVYEYRKVCQACGQEKPIEAFPLLRGKNQGYLQREPRCKECVKSSAREAARIKRLQQEQERIESSLALVWQERIRQKHQKNYDAALKRCYGKTLEEYNAMVLYQEGKCAICGESPNTRGEMLFVDHSHVTGAVRGLLCQSCNFGLGWFRDNPQSLQNAIHYLQHYHPWQEVVSEEKATTSAGGGR